jgi:hypothetical protein
MNLLCCKTYKTDLRISRPLSATEKEKNGLPALLKRNDRFATVISPAANPCPRMVLIGIMHRRHVRELVVAERDLLDGNYMQGTEMDREFWQRIVWMRCVGVLLNKGKRWSRLDKI